MKQAWQKFAGRIDALTLRERVLLFAAATTVILFAVYFAGLGPLLARQALLRTQVSQQQNNLSGMDAEITQKIQDYQRDPDEATRARLQAVDAEAARLGESLRTMQQGLVAPERMGPLIDRILRANGRLQLVAMRTLPVSSLNEPPPGEGAAQDKPAAADAKAETAAKLASIQAAMASASASATPPAAGTSATPAAVKPGSLLYRHGVEITVRGQYLDMIDYMNALETLPTQLFWGGARLEVEDYPTARLTLTLYTLSLDSKWLKL